MRMAIIFNHDDLNKLQTPIIIEMWDRVMSTGSGKRKLTETFTPDEINRIKRLYKLFYKWHFSKVGGTGIPDECHSMTIEDYQLTKRAVHFFATINRLSVY
jgi:hypothetical protein